MTKLSTTERDIRLQDVAAAIRDRQCFTDLAAVWSMSVPSTWLWCQRNVSKDDRRQLAMNGNRRTAATLRRKAA